MKLTISAIIQCPQTTRAIPTATAFGTKDSVISWIWVIDWNREIANPTTSEVMSTGAESFAATSRPASPISSTALVSTPSHLPNNCRPGP